MQPQSGVKLVLMATFKGRLVRTLSNAGSKS